MRHLHGRPRGEPSEWTALPASWKPSGRSRPYALRRPSPLPAENNFAIGRFAGVGLQLSPHGDECSATGTLRMISRRHVFHLGGYDPVAPETLFARFRRSQSSFQKRPTLALAARSWLPIWHRQNELSRAFIITSWTNRSSPLSTLPLAIAISPRADYFSGLFCRVFRCFPDRAKKEVDQ